MNKIELNANAALILSTIANGATSSKEVAEQMDVKTAVVTGNMASLKKHNLIEVNEGVLSLTKAGKKFVGGESKPEKPTTKTAKKATSTANPKTRKVQTGTKTEAARAVFKEMHGKKDVQRKDIIAAMVAIGLTKNGASTYIQNIKREMGLIAAK